MAAGPRLTWPLLCACFPLELQLNTALVGVSANHLPVLVHAWRARHGKDLSYLLEKEAGGWYETALLALIKGPIIYDAHLVQRACDGLGTNEQLLTELVIGRTPLSLDLLKATYRHIFHKDFDQSKQSPPSSSASLNDADTSLIPQLCSAS